MLRSAGDIHEQRGIYPVLEAQSLIAPETGRAAEAR
jgi:hypothetical protein